MTTLPTLRRERRLGQTDQRTLAVIGGYVVVVIAGLGVPELARPLWLMIAGGVLVVLAVWDLRTRRVPNAITYPAIAGALAAAASFGANAAVASLLGGVCGFGGLYVLALVSRGALGMGDVKLGTYIGVLLGATALGLSLAVGFLAGAGLAAVLLITRRASRKDTLPLAPFLVVPALLQLALGNGIVG